MVLLVGVTGCGKTLLLNNIVNYFFGVDLEDEWRLNLVDELDEIEERELGQEEEQGNKIFQDANVGSAPKSRFGTEYGNCNDCGNFSERTNRSESCRASAKSMTSWVTGYELRWQQGARLAIRTNVICLRSRTT